MADRDTAIQQRLPLQPRGTLHAQDVDLFRKQVFHWVPGGNGRFALHQASR